MSAVLAAGSGAPAASGGVWGAAWTRFRSDRVGLVSLAIVAAFLVLIVASASGLVARGWQQEVGVPNAPPHFVGPAPPTESNAIAQPTGPNVDISDVDPLAPRYKEWAERAAQLKTVETIKSETLPFGGDRLGRDVLAKAVKGAEISIMVGVLAALVATLIGTVLGALGGFFGGKVGDLLEWVYNVFTSIPGILLIFTFAAVLNRADAIIPRGVWSIVIILGLTGWTGIYRLVRAEFMKHAVREYVRAAEAIGASTFSRMFRHILPNVSHVALVQLSIHVVGFIKAEVILSYLGLGVAVDQVSWGTMLAEAQSELILGHWWQLAAATLFMAVFVTAFSLFTDALRDALDPKLRGLE
ncbi:MAG: ABC transporter permease [Burkholderiales bacterium]|jgi:peptide/nickel transport system permease protein|nr:ABC transporter permease [Burkholderiales bacterium]